MNCQSFYLYPTRYLWIFFLFSLTCISCNENRDVLVLENGFYFNGKTFIRFNEIVIQGDKILSINTTGHSIKGRRIELAGKYVIPGLIDAHTHLDGCPVYPYVNGDSLFNATSSLNCGVTTAVDLFFNETDFKNFKAFVNHSPQQYCSVIMAGPILTAPHSHGTEYNIEARIIRNSADAEKITNEVLDKGVDIIKVVYQGHSNKYSLDKKTLAIIVATAHKKNVKVFAHINNAAEAIDCVDAGVDVLAHMPQDSLTTDQLIRIKNAGTVIIPTITVMQSFLEGHNKEYLSDSLLWKTADPRYLSGLKTDLAIKPLFEKTIHNSFYKVNLANCIKMNIPLVAGTDAGNYKVFFGYSLHNELKQYVESGMSNAQALCSGTQNILGIFPDLNIGRIYPGYDADLIVLERNPLVNIKNSKSINLIFHKGILIKSKIKVGKS